MVECNVAIMTASMPGVTVFVRWIRGNTLEHEKPGMQRRESDAVGRRAPRFQRRRRSSSTVSERGEQYVMDGMVRSGEVLLETGGVAR